MHTPQHSSHAPLPQLLSSALDLISFTSPNSPSINLFTIPAISSLFTRTHLSLTSSALDLISFTSSNSPSIRRVVTDLEQALEMFQFHGSWNSRQQVALRVVMSHLRNLGHNAAVCKTKWETSTGGGLVSGSYEFIDVLIDSSSSNGDHQLIRYFIDLDFASKFEIARPSDPYKRLLSLLPSAAFVGEEEELKKMVKVMSDAAKRSLKSRELHLPPWQMNRYMQMNRYCPTASSLTYFDYLVLLAGRLADLSDPDVHSPVRGSLNSFLAFFVAASIRAFLAGGAFSSFKPPATAAGSCLGFLAVPRLLLLLLLLLLVRTPPGATSCRGTAGCLQSTICMSEGDGLLLAAGCCG